MSATTSPQSAASCSRSDGALSASAFHFPSAGHEFVRGAQTTALRRLMRLKPATVTMSLGGGVDWVTGASVMLRRDALLQSGLFDDGFFLYFEEVELMHRLRCLGWQVWSEPNSRVRHIGGASTGVTENQMPQAKPRYWFRSRLRYFALTKGKAYSDLANLAWIAGFILLGGPRLLLSPASRRRAAPGELRGIIQAGLWPSNDISRRSVPTFSSAFGDLPAWVRNT